MPGLILETTMRRRLLTIVLAVAQLSPQVAKRAALISAILVASIILGCSTVNQNLSQTCYKGNCLGYTTWGQNIDTTINQQAVGYAYIILNNGLLVASNAYGKARTASNPPQTAMTLDARSNAASVTKTMTAVAALKLLAAKNVSVTSTIAAYLPQSWSLGQGVSAITFAQLLTHTSGIRDPLNLGTSYASLKTIMAQNILPANKVKNYQNANFALFRILIPYLNGFNDQGVQDIAAATDQGYLTYMSSVYSPDIPISCKPGLNPVLSYPYPPGATKGTDWGDWTDLCGGGGLQLSVNHMGVFMAHLMLGLYLPKTSNNPNETTLSEMVSKMYGWDYTWPTTYGTCVAKNGDLGGGMPFVPILSSLYVYCPDTGLGFVGLANSTLPVMATHNYGFSGALDDIVFQAYTASWKPQP
jgi:CubicO group peptidase (beta-lactamase class C family)